MGEEKKEEAATDVEAVNSTKWFTGDELKLHNCAEDCWVSIYGDVFDLSQFLGENRGECGVGVVSESLGWGSK